jgi:thymidylate kinase
MGYGSDGNTAGMASRPKPVTIQNSTLVLDEGPIFHMAYLQIYGSDVLNSPTARSWWEKIYTQWSQTLALVVLLDAPDLILIERIRARKKESAVKTKGNDYAVKYITNLREKYEYLLDKLTTKNKNLTVFRFDTDQVLLDQVYSKVFASLQFI